MKNNMYCSICGKEKPLYYNKYINKYVYLKCKCEEEKEKEETEQKRKKAIEYYLKQRTQSSHVQEREATADLNTLKVDENNKTAIELARVIANMLFCDTEKNNSKNGLIIKGNRGSGKTYIACAIINEYNKKHPLNESAIRIIANELDKGFENSLDINIASECKIIKEDELLQLYGKYDFRSDTAPLDEYRKAKKLLVIDDMGTSYADSKKIQSAYFNIIDYRYSNNLSTIVTTNMNNNELKEYLGDRTYDRLIASCFSISLTSNESRR